MRGDLEAFAASAVARLGDAGADPQRLVVHVRDTQVFVGVHDRWVVRVVVTADGAVLSTIDPDSGQWQAQPPRQITELDAAFADLVPAAARAIDQLTVHRLVAGRRYRIARAFVDITGGAFVVGEELVFESLHHVPYDDGYTLRFEGRSMLIRGDGDVFARFGVLVVEA
jgi:hypothetical protein